MSRCWASVLGDCNTMSGEHVVSSAIFKPGCGCPILVEGVKRIRGGEPTQGAEKSNILCRRHNSLLSPLDSTIGKLSKFQADANENSFDETLYLEGELLERWLLKTIVNSGVAGWTGTTKFLPSEDIVKTIFGFAKPPHRAGLYSVEGVDPNHSPSGGVSVIPIHLASHRGLILAGAYVSVNGMTFLGAFHDELAGLLEKGVCPDLLHRFSPDGLKHLYRPGCLFMDRKRGGRVFIGLSWGGLIRFSDGTVLTFPQSK